MTSEPRLVETPIGPVGVGLTRPADEPRSAVLVLPGGGRRVGPNRLWPRLAEALAKNGALVARVDLPGHGDSDLITPTARNDLAAVRHATKWFMDQAGGLDLTVVCGCYGSRLVTAVLEEAPVRRMGLVVPYLRVRYPNVRAAGLRGRLTRAVVRRRPGVLDRRMVDSLARISDTCPIWILVGEHDVAARYVGAVRAAAEDRSHVAIEVVDGASIHTHSSPETQEITIERVTNWVREPVGEIVRK